MDIVPLTIWREARGEGRDGMLAVAWVIENRTHNPQWASDAERVCLQRKQFSCWNDMNAEREMYPLPGDVEYALCRELWATLATEPDPTGGATFYCNPQALAINPFANSRYEQTAQIGKHLFYKAKS